LFDLKRDSVADIAKVIRETVTPGRAQGIADQLRPKSGTVSEAAKAFIVAVKRANLTKEQRTKEVKKLETSISDD
jgi:hypothetical protein